MDENQRVRNKQDLTRYGNSTLPIMLIKYGNDANRYELKAVYVDYLRAPKYVNLNQEDLDKIGDDTLILEFPDYVIYEVINEIVRLVMENTLNPRILTQPAFTTTIPTMGSSSK